MLIQVLLNVSEIIVIVMLDQTLLKDKICSIYTIALYNLTNSFSFFTV